MQYTVLVKALHPIKGWVKFEVAVEAKNPTDAAIQAKRQPSVRDYSVYNVLSVSLVTKEQAQEQTKKEQTEPPKPTLVKSEIPQPEKPSEPIPEKLPVDQPKAEQAQPVVKKGF